MKTSELTGVALDWAVAKCEGNTFAGDYPHLLASGFRPPRYSTDWAQGGPIIEREQLQTTPHFHSAGFKYPEGLWDWRAYVLGPCNIDGSFEQSGPTPLIAAMRCYVASKLGDEVDIPKGLL